MSSPLTEDARAIVGSSSSPFVAGDEEGGRSSWIDPSTFQASTSNNAHMNANTLGRKATHLPSILPSSSSAHMPVPSSLPRHLSTRSLGRSASSSARNSTETLRRPPLVDRVTSTRSLFLPSINYTETAPTDEDWRSTAIGSTPLDRTIDRIGMGRYQWTVLILSGLGWAADNMWIQAVAIILPHFQRYFALSDGVVGLASSSIFIGMFIGSIAWGTISDSYGRRAAFNITLAVTAIFGCLSAIANTFPVLCFLLFAVGTGVGGSMPTDSSNLVENLPVRKHSYVTALSVFFSAGSVVSSLIGLMVLSARDKEGWRWLLGSLAGVTVMFVSARVVFFRLLESPKYLVHAGRREEARDILQKIQNFNGGQVVNLRVEDVEDDSHRANEGRTDNVDLEGSAHSLREAGTSEFSTYSNLSRKVDKAPSDRMEATCAEEEDARDDDDDGDITTGDASSRPLLDEGNRSQKSDAETSNRNRNRNSSAISHHIASYDLPASLTWLPRTWHPSAADLVSRYTEMFSPTWKRTTILIWIIWGGMSYGFTTFNVLLPKLLESRYDDRAISIVSTEPDDASIHRALIDILVYSLSSLPGSLISAYMVETRLGRIGTMVTSTALMAAAVLLFSLTYWRSSLTVVSVSSSISYAAIYGYTPEVMAPTIRATACGTASAISRVAGIIAPLLAGWAFSLAPAVPLFLATSVLLVVTGAMALLPIETRGRAVDVAQGNGGDGSSSH
ncbi:uncharacterized protein MEPE_00220 [Melanopsichium pennsylvanicum]|uniref:Major facilitator superfamily (MFS) profile domain-containing protein n=2 Tax=Melanopsichium pennsylvanicum TaxID=63383 RepID=A0AAJ4XFH9_9BASI|nr:mfs general substrate transporter [Melanopsichium pennsylvanicum 4]SNX81515.1 uncharacterized protein MEPE_00220 [Melanopsichium pennsylvanicum]